MRTQRRCPVCGDFFWPAVDRQNYCSRECRIKFNIKKHKDKKQFGGFADLLEYVERNNLRPVFDRCRGKREH